MIKQETEFYVKNCMKTWLICEACAYMEMKSEKPNQEVVFHCQCCAEICFALVCRLIANFRTELDQFAFLCMLHCKQCAAVCKNYTEVEDLQYCSKTCGNCSTVLRKLIVPLQLN